jgi:hypothetical protein
MKYDKKTEVWKYNRHYNNDSNLDPKEDVRTFNIMI